MPKLNLPPALDDHLIEGRARLELDFDQPYLLGPLFGDYDRHLVMIEDRLGVHINARGNRVMIEGEPDSAARAASTASAGSDLPVRRRAWRLGRSTSTTLTCAARNDRARLAP